MTDLRDWAGEIIEGADIIKKFKISIFWIIWYNQWENESEVVDFLNIYRQYEENKYKQYQKDELTLK